MQFLNNVADDGYNYDNSYFGAVSLDFQKETDSGTKWRLTLVPNRGTDSVIGNGGLVHEASVSIPLTDLQTRFIAGHLPNWSGYEYLQPTLNKLITHNMLFDFTLPAAYTGAGFELTRGKWIVKGLLGQVNASKNPQGETGQALAYRIALLARRVRGLRFRGSARQGAQCDRERHDTDQGARPGDGCHRRRDRSRAAAELAHRPVRVDASFTRGDWTAQGQLSYGRQEKASITPAADGSLRDAQWWGASGLLAYKFTPRLEGIARADYIANESNGGGLLGSTFADDRNGIGPDPSGDPNRGANRFAVSLGMSYLFDLNPTFKAEYRLDRADLPVFLYVHDGSYPSPPWDLRDASCGLGIASNQ